MCLKPRNRPTLSAFEDVTDQDPVNLFVTKKTMIRAGQQSLVPVRAKIAGLMTIQSHPLWYQQKKYQVVNGIVSIEPIEPFKV